MASQGIRVAMLRRRTGPSCALRRIGQRVGRINEAKDRYKKTTKALATAQKASIAAKTELDKVEKGTIPDAKIGKTITLSDIVSQHSQYEGTRKGKQDFKNYPTFNVVAQKQHLERFEAAKKAVLDLAADPKLADKYWNFVGGNLRPKGARQGETKIGGNYFRLR